MQDPNLPPGTSINDIADAADGRRERDPYREADEREDEECYDYDFMGPQQ